MSFYYDRTEGDLTLVTEMNLESESYSFHLFGVFYHEPTRQFYVGYDSGCSCPTPWDGWTIGDGDGPHDLWGALGKLDWVYRDRQEGLGPWFTDEYARARNELLDWARENGLISR